MPKKVSESKPKAKLGRPSKYTPELAAEICRAVATSADGLKAICDAHDNFPAKQTVNEWRYDFPDFSAMYAKAKQQQAELLAEEILEISDNRERDTIETEKGFVANTAAVARDRLKVDTRKWIACKLMPKVYGDRVEKPEPDNSTTFQIISDALQAIKDKHAKDY